MEFIPAERKEMHLIDIDSVRQHPDNPNNGDTDWIEESLAEFGLYSPITVQLSTRLIIKGNHTWYAAKARDESQILAIYADVDDATALRILIGDNEGARRAKPTLPQLHAVLEDLRERQLLRGTGHTAETVTELADRIRKTAHTPLDPDRPNCSECGRPMPKAK